MKKHSLSTSGLSLSQAQSISNLCNQRAREIDAKLNGVNNYNKTVMIGKEKHIIIKGKTLPIDTMGLLLMKSRLHACQAFLMENIKAKDALLNVAKLTVADLSEIAFPTEPDFAYPEIISVRNEEWGWEQLTAAEVNEFMEAEAFAAHVGQFIHKGGVLDALRAELPTIPAIEWMTIKDGEKSPVSINIHHDPEKLLKLHEQLAATHRQYEQRVNYFKAKVKNLVTEENARVAKLNADAQNEITAVNNQLAAVYNEELRKHRDAVKGLQAEFEKSRQARIREVAAMRISVDKRFQDVIDEFLKQLSAE